VTKYRALVAAAILVTALAGCGSDDQDPSTDPSPTAVVDQTPAAAPQVTTAPPLAGPDKGLRDWIYVVGQDIRPGTYVTTVPADHGHPCYWARLRSFGEANAIIDEGNPEPGERVEVIVKVTDKGFKVSNGCVWRPGTPA
jgi:hypothetical protein